jgi:uncharacterized membrane protein
VRKWIPSLLVIAAAVVSLIAYPSMPERVPTHWNMAGEVDGWSSRFQAAWMLPLIMAVMVVVFRILPHIDPKRANYEKFGRVYDALVITILAFLLGVHAIVLLNGAGYALPVERIILGAAGAFFIVIGALLPRARPNWFVGIRTPWTLSSDLAWERTHRLGGALFMLMGALAIIAAVFLPRHAPVILITSGVGSALFLVGYSYVVWKQDPSRPAAQ